MALFSPSRRRVLNDADPRFVVMEDRLPNVSRARWAPLVWAAMLVAGFAFWAYVGGPLLFWAFRVIAGWLA